MSKKHRKTNIYLLIWARMKENWIKKLIELLNEREEIKKTWIFYVSYDDYDWEFYWLADDEVSEIVVQDSFVCSKKYWFIQWLIDNDKIDFDKIQIWFQLTLWYWKYDSLLMLLSISDTPIEDLISYLK